MSGQPNEWDRFFIFYVISTLTSLVAQSLGLLIGAAAPQLEVSYILLAIYFLSFRRWGNLANKEVKSPHLWQPPLNKIFSKLPNTLFRLQRLWDQLHVYHFCYLLVSSSKMMRYQFIYGGAVTPVLSDIHSKEV